ncbi:hypothetical protein ACIP5Y_33130 [Nocardia sp. NPDC088792]|uniref:hypothetical protein n=1 Tax=Nocardia sp. NPDC088792 TaxID=3364332 RepID=UPI00380A0C47
MPSPKPPAPLSSPLRPVSSWTPGNPSAAGSTSPTNKSRVFNFNNLDQQHTAQLVTRINRGNQMKKSARATNPS